jgi:hypothetical protein
MNEVDSSAILWPYAIACTCLIEGLSDERRGQFAQAGRLETGFLRAREHGQIDVGGEDRERDTRMGTRYFQVPEDFYRIGLLAGGAPG